MKKLSIVWIISVFSICLIGLSPTDKLVRLEIQNDSSDTVYMRLVGQTAGAFYYLTIQDGAVKTFTILVDNYHRTTWACGGIVNNGSLNITGNVKLKFVLCGKMPMRTVLIDQNDDGEMDCFHYFFINPDGSLKTGFYCDGVYRFPNFGEPTQEKVAFFREFNNTIWIKDPLFTFHQHWAWGKSLSLWILVKLPDIVWSTYTSPRGLLMRYRY